MKKHCRYVEMFIMPAMLIALALAAWSGAGEAQEPNAPVNSQELAAVSETLEPNAPVETEEPNAPAESEAPDIPAVSPDTTSPEAGQEPSGPTSPSDSWDVYRIVVERNMFSRQRGPRVQRTRRQVPVAPPAPDPESYVVLKGVVQEDGEFIAFLEDTQSGQIRRVREGDSVLRGKVKSLTLDSIEYEVGDRTTTVTMGFNLQGGSGGATFTGMYELTQTPSTTSAAGATESSTQPTEDEAEILRQLMERRQQQIGQ